MMRLTLPIGGAMLILLLSALTACGDKDSDEANDGASAPLITPAEGDWYSSGSVVLEDGCQLLDDSGGAFTETTTLTLLGPMSFTMGADDDTVTCTLTGDGGAFYCDDYVESQSYQAPDPEVTVVITGSVSGTFTSPTTGVGYSEANITCSGPDCGLLEAELGFALPCYSTLKDDIYQDDSAN